MTKVYLAMQKIINRLRSEDGTFDGEALFAIGVLATHVDISQEELMMIANGEVSVMFQHWGRNKVFAIRELRNALQRDVSISEAKLFVEGKPFLAPRDEAMSIKEKCEEGGASVIIS